MNLISQFHTLSLNKLGLSCSSPVWLWYCDASRSLKQWILTVRYFAIISPINGSPFLFLIVPCICISYTKLCLSQTLPMDAEADPVLGSGGWAEELSGWAVAVPSVIVVVDGDCVDGPPSEDASRLAPGASSTGQMMNHLLPVCRTEQRKRTLIHS